ncbi:MAG TPA: response regulator transcription factor [Candidatus Binatia bacterium]|nr:response regulator transcription factor [Candidatus Binatia bacterium]
MRVLVIEDDEEAARYVVKGLAESGHVADHAADGTRGLELALSGPYDVLVVDRMLPKLDGVAIVAALRRSGITIPVLVLSALGRVEDRVEGLKSGADDYLPKPFAFAELLARLEALVRRAKPEAAETRLRVADLELDVVRRTVRRGGAAIDLKPREFRILEYLMRHAGQVVTRTMLLENVWDYQFDPQTNVIDVHMSRLRQKIDGEGDRPLLQTVRGAGYRLRSEA